MRFSRTCGKALGVSQSNEVDTAYTALPLRITIRIKMWHVSFAAMINKARRLSEVRLMILWVSHPFSSVAAIRTILRRGTKLDRILRILLANASMTV